MTREAKITRNYWHENLGINKMLASSTAGKLRLGYPKPITPEETPF